MRSVLSLLLFSPMLMGSLAWAQTATPPVSQTPNANAAQAPTTPPANPAPNIPRGPQPGGITLGPDDKPAFPPAPAGFDKPREGIEHGKIETTLPKAKELVRYIEKVITKAKKGDLHNRRQVISKLQTVESAHKLVDEIALAVHPILLGSGKPLFNNIPGRIKLQLTGSKTYSSGLVFLTYNILYN